MHLIDSRLTVDHSERGSNLYKQCASTVYFIQFVVNIQNVAAELWELQVVFWSLNGLNDVVNFIE